MFRSEERKKEYKKTFADPRRKREDLQSQIRKQIRDKNLQKKRTQSVVSADVDVELNSATCTPFVQPPTSIIDGQNYTGEAEADALKNAINWTPAALAPFVNGLRSPDINTQLMCTRHFRKLLSLEVEPPIEQVVNAGVVPIFVEFLGRFDHPELQFEAAWAITNVASGNTEQTRVATDSGAVPKLIALLEAPKEDVREQAIWALGNIAGDCAECRDLVLAHGALQPLLYLLANSQKESVLRNATWTVSNLFRGKPKPAFDRVKTAIPYLAKLIEHKDVEVLTDACWALSYISDGNENQVQAVLDSGACKRLVELMDHVLPVIQTPALRTVGNIATGNDRQTQMIVDAGCIPILYKLLYSEKKTIRKEACWTLSNITAGTRDQIQAFLQTECVEKLLDLMVGTDFDIQREASWAICNAASGGDLKQAEALANRGCIKPICSILASTDSKLVGVALRALENILRVGQNLMQLHVLQANPYAKAVIEADGLRFLEILQESKVAIIYKKAKEIITRYFPDEDDDIDDDDDDGEAGIFHPGGRHVPAGGFQF